MAGTTSAHAENTWGRKTAKLVMWNYLRARGEYIQAFRHGGGDEELPPRTRRIPEKNCPQFFHHGTTSAHAENTTTATPSFCRTWNYLRARGEYAAVAYANIHATELPPRTRRILKVPSWVNPTKGTTSAHAENTGRSGWTPEPPRNYLRARGEYITSVYMIKYIMELPPRTRRIRDGCSFLGVFNGTTSAHAENTGAWYHENFMCWNYLRARGEYVGRERIHEVILELPPRTRRIRRWCPRKGKALGTTSAHAENTCPLTYFRWSWRNYLRARGEYDNRNRPAPKPVELPPRTRRIQVVKRDIRVVIGTTSAHAENT